MKFVLNSKILSNLNQIRNEICSSTFVSQSWFYYFYNGDIAYTNTFDAVASGQFQALAALCKSSEDSVNSIKYISGRLIPFESFQNGINSFEK
jgi:hypothetical protein